jgi:type IV pilus assembly protein PilQ
VAFLDVGTLLRLRPFIASDGLIRLEVHPELSTGNVVVQSGLTLPNKSITQVTTNIMCRDGCTVVLGGLIREDLKNDTKQLPFLGSVPFVGPLFRNKTESIDRVELIVLLTPRIVGDAVMGEEGERMEHEFSARQGTYFAKMSQLGKRHMGEKHYRYARASVEAGDYESAMKQVNLAIHYDPMNRDAIMLREQIVEEGGFQNESVGQYLRQGLAPFSHGKDYSRKGYPWKTPPEQGFDNLPSEMPDKGTLTPRTFIEPQRPPVLPK